MTPDVQCRWCPERVADCPDPDLHEYYHRQSETTWRLQARTVMAVLTPDDELEVDRAATR